MSYDLLEVPDGYRTDVVLLLAPYFDQKFIKMIVKKLAPGKIRLVIDDGVREEDIQQLIKAAGGRDKVKVALAEAAGLVHIKGYYAEFVKTDGRNRRRRRFFYGSANATDAAFNGRRNAELIASVDLLSGEDRDFLDYLAHIIKSVEEGSGRISGNAFGPLRNSPILHLPSFQITAPGPAPGFDAWLQRGLLAAKYRETQQFLKVSVVLKKRLPQDVIATVFSNRGLMETGERNVVRFRYISDTNGRSSAVSADDDEAEEEASTSPLWKSRYCTWTHLGDWPSDDCYRAHGTGMVLKNGDKRRSKIEALLENGKNKSWVEARKGIFLDTLSKTWTELLEKEVPPSDYLRGGARGLDSGYYDDQFAKKLLADHRLAQDSDFRTRYINGYEFPTVPRFRQDAASWDEFVRSWCESVALEVSKRSTRSLLAQKMIGVTQSDELEAEEIGNWLRKSWEHEIEEGNERTTVGEHLMAYHVE